VTTEASAITPADHVGSAIAARYIYSACVKTITPDISVLYGPWFTEGVLNQSAQSFSTTWRYEFADRLR
jgi:hypothetical protein